MPRAEPLLDEERGSGGVASPSGCLERELRSPRVPFACVAFLGVFALVTTEFAGGSSDGGAGANGAPPPPPSGPPKTVLVFGDGWGDSTGGPTWHQLEDTFAKHSVPATVRGVNAAIRGTAACQWDNGDVHNRHYGKGQALASEAFRLFPETKGKVDFVWYSAGLDDMVADQVYQDCESKIGGNFGSNPELYPAHLVCLEGLAERVSACTKSLLDGLFEQSPDTRVVQCGYDLPVLDGAKCMEQAADRAPFCGSSVECAVKSLWEMQPMLLDKLEEQVNVGGTQRYTGLNIVGAIQQAAGEYGPPGCGTDGVVCEYAKIGEPLLDRGSPKEYIDNCVYPHYPGSGAPGSEGTRDGAQAIGEALWDEFFKTHV